MAGGRWSIQVFGGCFGLRGEEGCDRRRKKKGGNDLLVVLVKEWRLGFCEEEGVDAEESCAFFPSHSLLDYSAAPASLEC